MRVVIALGGNALAGDGDRLAPDPDRVRSVARAIAGIATTHAVVVTHGNGPQVGLLATRAADRGDPAPPLDVLDAQTEGLLGYALARELGSALGARDVAAVLTQVEVDPHDAAFVAPEKPVGPPVPTTTADALAAARGWTFVAVDPDPSGAARARRVVPSPTPRRVLELRAIEVLVDAGVVVVCAGGGGVPVVLGDDGVRTGVEAVVDKDHTSALLGIGLGADRLLLLTDVDAVVDGFGRPGARPIGAVTAAALASRRYPPGTMGPKVAAACRFVLATGGTAAVGSVAECGAVFAGDRGTQISR